MGFNRVYSVVLPEDCGVFSPFDGCRAWWSMLRVQEGMNSDGFDCFKVKAGNEVGGEAKHFES